MNKLVWLAVLEAKVIEARAMIRECSRGIKSSKKLPTTARLEMNLKLGRCLGRLELLEELVILMKGEG